MKTIKYIILSLLTLALFGFLVWFGILIHRMYRAIAVTQAREAAVETFLTKYMADQVKEFNNKEVQK